MGLGVLDTRDPNVPGTVHVYDAAATTAEVKESDRSLKRHGDIILVPQPSDDPNDPLNWSRGKRDLILFILCLISVIASALSPLLAANTLTLSLWFGLDFTRIALLTGYNLLGVGVAGFIFVASARVWGKRHLYLLGTLLIVIGSAWGGATGDNYTSLLWARIIQGVGLAPFEALVNASVGDLYFVHERGVRMAASNMALFGGAFFTPILVGKITHTLGWWWTFYFIAIFAGVLFPVIFFFVPETAYRRADYLNTDMQGDHGGSRASNTVLTPKTEENGTNGHTRAHSDGPPSSHSTAGYTAAPPAKASFLQTLSPFNGRKTDENFFKLLLRPFPLFFHPAIFWACLIQGALIGWTVLIGVVLAAIFLGPPLWFDEVQTGYFYAGPFLGAFVGFVFAGLFTDVTTRAMIRRNGGVYEPEFRIVLVVPQLLVGCLGLYGFGWSSSSVQAGGWFLPDFFFALEVAGMVIGAVASALYVVDAYRDLAVEAFTCMLIFKNIFSFGLTWSAYDWLLQNGIFNTFIIVASIQVAICLLSIPMYVFGKWNRLLMKRYNILKMTRLQ